MPTASTAASIGISGIAMTLAQTPPNQIYVQSVAQIRSFVGWLEDQQTPPPLPEIHCIASLFIWPRQPVKRATVQRFLTLPPAFAGSHYLLELILGLRSQSLAPPQALCSSPLRGLKQARPRLYAYACFAG